MSGIVRARAYVFELSLFYIFFDLICINMYAVYYLFFFPFCVSL